MLKLWSSNSIFLTSFSANKKRSSLLLNKINELLKGKIKNKNICFLGVTFKANTDDMRDSSTLTMIPSLAKKGARINYYDPTGEKNVFKKIKNVTFVNNIKFAIHNSDLVIIHTDWNDFKSINFKSMIKKKNFIIYDMRNIYSPLKMKKAKIKYFGIGR